jgi:hypothetical protein
LEDESDLSSLSDIEEEEKDESEADAGASTTSAISVLEEEESVYDTPRATPQHTPLPEEELDRHEDVMEAEVYVDAMDVDGPPPNNNAPPALVPEDVDNGPVKMAEHPKTANIILKEGEKLECGTLGESNFAIL